jgi:ATP/maltotriose-dependent transcriptional regulator MalT
VAPAVDGRAGLRSPLVEDGRWLVGQEPGLPVVLESAAWFAWLDAHTAFRYAGPAGQFAAHKQRIRPNTAYWQAFRKHAGRLHSVHLGRSSKLTAARLAAAARALSSSPRSGLARLRDSGGWTSVEHAESARLEQDRSPRLQHRGVASSEQQAADRAAGRSQGVAESLSLRLSQRELEVLRCVAMGQSNQGVCLELGIALSTVKSHLSMIYRKLGVDSRTRALREAYALGLLSPGSS